MPQPPGPPIRRLFILLFLALNFFYLLTSSGRVRTIDEVTVDLQAESLATRGSSAVPQAISGNLFYGKLDRQGRPQSPYGLGQAVLVLPWYEAGRVLRNIVPGIPERARDIVLDAVLVASSATFSALAAALAMLIFLRLGIAVRPALAATLLIALATPVFSYSSWFFSEPLTTALFMAAALSMFTGERDKAISAQRAAWAGLCLGVALWVRPTNVLAAAVFLVAVLVRDRKTAQRPVFVFAAIVTALGAAYLLRNRILFGSPLDFGYPIAAEGGKPLNSFQTPLFQGLFGLLLSPGKSVLIFAPPILLAVAGIKPLARLDKGLAFVAAATPLVYLFFFARYTQWEGGYCFGPRYLVPSLALLCLGLGPMLADAWPKERSWVRKLALALFAFGLFVQVIGMATSFLEDQAGGNYYDDHFNYRMSYDPLVSQTQLLRYYATSSDPAPIGRGFDRWFVFLAKMGVAHNAILLFWGLEWVGVIIFTWQLEGIVAASRPPPAP
jgi:hypothetical protein